MTLAETSLRVLVGLSPPAAVTAGLIRNGREVLDARPVIVADWSAQGPAVAGRVTFGPFNLPVSFDAVRLYHGGEALVDLPRRSVMNLDPGEIFQEDIFLDGTDG